MIRKRALSAALTLLLVVSCLSLLHSSRSLAAETEFVLPRQCAVGDIIEFGTYPQSRVTDDALIAQLGMLNLKWISYRYYCGTGGINYAGQMYPDDFMRYADVTLDGVRYRAVRFTSYRPYDTAYELRTEDRNPYGASYQDDNGYSCGKIYWFRFDPLRWRVLDPETGLVISDVVLDSQAFHNYIYTRGTENGTRYFGDPSFTFYNTIYDCCDLRNWLNNTFYQISFTPEEKDLIRLTHLETPSANTIQRGDQEGLEFDSPDTDDYVFLPSLTEMMNPAYGFPQKDTADPSRVFYGTEYAECQGLMPNKTGGA